MALDKRRVCVALTICGTVYFWLISLVVPSCHVSLLRDNGRSWIDNIETIMGFRLLEKWLLRITRMEEMEYLVASSEGQICINRYLPVWLYLIGTAWLVQFFVVLLLVSLEAMSKTRMKICISLSVFVLLSDLTTRQCIQVLMEGATQKQTKENNVVALSLNTLQILFILKWLASSIWLLLVARAYQLKYGKTPTKWWQYPRYFGTKDMVFCTLYGVGGITLFVSSIFYRLGFLVEAGMNIVHLAWFASTCQAMFRLTQRLEKDKND